MNSSVSISQAASTVIVTMGTTKTTSYLTSVWTRMNVWKADLTATNVLTSREGKKGSSKTK